MAGLAGCILPRPSFAADYPEHELNWLIYQSPGGTVDITTRTLQPSIEASGFKSRLEYAVGGAGRIARTKLFTAKPDGYTIMTEVAPGGVVDEILFKVPYKVEDFSPIFGWIRSGFQICVRAESPIKTFEDFVAETKKRRLTVGTIGRGSAQHIYMVSLRDKLGLNFDLVHFDGGSPEYTAVIGGHIDAGGGGIASAKRQGDRLRFIAVSGLERDPLLPDVPTVKELGYDVAPVDQLFFANTSPGVPADRLALLTKAFSAAVNSPEVKALFEKTGDRITPLTAEQINAVHASHRELVIAYKEELRPG